LKWSYVMYFIIIGTGWEAIPSIIDIENKKKCAYAEGKTFKVAHAFLHILTVAS
jgi:hypothetical protein